MLEDKEILVKSPEGKYEEALNLLGDGFFQLMMKSLQGKVLTLVDACIENERQCKAAKDAMKSIFYEEWKLLRGYFPSGEGNVACSGSSK